LQRTIAAILFLSAIITPATASVDDLQAIYGILRVDEHRDRAVPVSKWDPSSPQHLVRLDGKLYQESAGLYYEVIPDVVSVRLAEGVRNWDELVSRAAPQLRETLSRLTPIRKNSLGIVDLFVPDKIDLVTACAIIDGTGLVRYAEVATRGAYAATQTDPLYGDQWALNNTGQSGGTPGADIDAERAWDLTAGDPSVIVAILDSGTDVDHEDLAAGVWHNDGENPTNGVDDDGNGYVDDWEGWDFENNNNDPRSGSSHGTFVTGIVNAAGSNGVGVAGIAGGRGGPGVRGMALGIGSSAPNAAVLDDAIVYAADNGARVITISVAIGQTQAIDDALDYAYNVKDVFIDCAAGNASSAVAYPATRPEVVAVAATNDDDARTWFSNLGPEIEVAAPGEGLLSTTPGDNYTTDAGTSFSAPYVAGLAGLIRGRDGGEQPERNRRHRGAGLLLRRDDRDHGLGLRPRRSGDAGRHGAERHRERRHRDADGIGGGLRHLSRLDRDGDRPGFPGRGDPGVARRHGCRRVSRRRRRRGRSRHSQDGQRGH
jgi:subtilisin family serine protease